MEALDSFEKLSDSLDQAMTSPKVKEDSLLSDFENSSVETTDEINGSPLVDALKPTTESLYYVTDDIDKPLVADDEIYTNTAPLVKSNSTSSHETELNWNDLMKANMTATSTRLNSLEEIDEDIEEEEDIDDSSSSRENDDYEDDEYEELVKMIMSKKSNHTAVSNLTLNKNNRTSSTHLTSTSTHGIETAMLTHTTESISTTVATLISTTTKSTAPIATTTTVEKTTTTLRPQSQSSEESDESDEEDESEEEDESRNGYLKNLF